MFDYDEQTSKDAAESIRKDAPDLSWVYLWYTDDAGHIDGNGKYFDEYVRKADAQVARVWDAVKYREANFDEDWMVVVTTDHGRGENGHGHGGQSERERTTWISTNVPVNSHFTDGTLAITDIAPSISRYLGFEIPRDILWEQDGMSFVGEADICDLKTMPYDDTVELKWRILDSTASVTVYAAATNDFRNGGRDEYIRLAGLPAGTSSYVVDLKDLPDSGFYKFVIASPGNHLNRWFRK